MRLILKTITALVFVFLIVLGVVTWQTHAIKPFCTRLEKGMAINEVYQLARTHDFYFKRAEINTDHVMIMNHAAPFFRMGCSVSIKEQRVERSLFVSGD